MWFVISDGSEGDTQTIKLWDKSHVYINNNCWNEGFFLWALWQSKSEVRQESLQDGKLRALWFLDNATSCIFCLINFSWERNKRGWWGTYSCCGGVLYSLYNVYSTFKYMQVCAITATLTKDSGQPSENITTLAVRQCYFCRLRQIFALCLMFNLLLLVEIDPIWQALPNKT